jgi:hypothetical protein
MYPEQWFVGRLCLGPLLKLLNKEISDDRTKRDHFISLLVELPTNREVWWSEDMPK